MDHFVGKARVKFQEYLAAEGEKRARLEQEAARKRAEEAAAKAREARALERITTATGRENQPAAGPDSIGGVKPGTKRKRAGKERVMNDVENAATDQQTIAKQCRNEVGCFATASRMHLNQAHRKWESASVARG